MTHTDLETWIEREFGGLGDPPVLGESFMSVEVAKDLVRRAVANTSFQCCRNTPDPGPWRAGVDDGAESEMVKRMHSLRDNLSYRTPIYEFIAQLRTAVQIDSRTTLGGDIQRCLLSNAAHRLTLIVEKIDPHPWRTWRGNFRDAWAVFRRRAVALYTRGTVYDWGWESLNVEAQHSALDKDILARLDELYRSNVASDGDESFESVVIRAAHNRLRELTRTDNNG